MSPAAQRTWRRSVGRHPKPWRGCPYEICNAVELFYEEFGDSFRFWIDLYGITLPLPIQTWILVVQAARKSCRSWQTGRSPVNKS